MRRFAQIQEADQGGWGRGLLYFALSLIILLFKEESHLPGIFQYVPAAPLEILHLHQYQVHLIYLAKFGMLLNTVL